MDPVALAAAIGGPVVGAVAILASRFEGGASRRHALDLAEQRNRHEREMARADRFFSARRVTYEELIAISAAAVVTIERVLQPRRLAFSGGGLARPSDTEYLAMQARLAVVGSPAAIEAFDLFGSKTSAFWDAFTQLAVLSDGTPEAANAKADCDEAKKAVETTFARLRELVRDELALL